jgi:hypothetical protein
MMAIKPCEVAPADGFTTYELLSSLVSTDRFEKIFPGGRFCRKLSIAVELRLDFPEDAGLTCPVTHKTQKLDP